MARFLFASDIHFWNGFPFSHRNPKTMITDRLHDIVNALRQIGAYAEEHQIPDILLLGDIFHQRLLDALTLKVGIDALSDLGKQARVSLIPGDHDAYNADAHFYTVDALRDLGVVNVIGGPFSSQGVDFYALPYKPEAAARAALNSLSRSTKEEVVLLMHQTVLGSRAGAWTAEFGLRPEEMDQWLAVLSGHFHTAQSFSERGHYLGAPMQHNFGDEGEERGFWDVTFDSAGMQRQFVPVRAPKFFTVHAKIENGELFHDIRDPAAMGEYLRLSVEVKGRPSPEMQKVVDDAVLGALVSGLRHVKVSWRVSETGERNRIKTSAMSGKLSFLEAVHGYVSLKGEAELSGKLTQVGEEALRAVGALGA